MAQNLLLSILTFGLGIALISTAPSDHIQKGFTVAEFNCYDVYNNGYIGDIPHPNDCSQYLTCTLGIDGIAQATVRPCNQGLYYHMNKCQCDWPQSAICFDQGNPEHAAMRFTCAKPIVSPQPQPEEEHGIHHQ